MSDYPWPDPGTPLADLPTPMPVIDEDRMRANILRVQSYVDGIGKAFRPHIKTHKLPFVAGLQVEAGAVGLNCQKLTEAEVFAEAGFQDILITYNMLGADRLARLAALNRRIDALAVTADSTVVVDGLAAAFSGERRLTVLVECDTGAGRCGVQSPEAAQALARRIAQAKGLRFGGLMTYPPTGGADRVETFLARTRVLLDGDGIGCPVVTNGGSPDLFSAHLVPSATEHRAGTYVYNDRSMVRAGHARLEDCAMQVLATVVSRPTPDRAILDAGSKALTSDLLGFADHGLIADYPEARIIGLSEEHGTVDLSACPDRRPAVGERVRVVPNHTCVVTNLFDRIVFHRGGVVSRVETVVARGRVW
jgi:D-serine deaminase-like pyridoxal phosphate-dependent protein